MVGIKTQDGTAKQCDPGTSRFSVHGASGRYFQLICYHGQMILDGSTFEIMSSSGCAVLPQSLSSPLLFPVLDVKWMRMCWGRGLKEVFFSGDAACLVSISSPILFHVLEDVSYNANQKGCLSPVRSLREVVRCWSSLFIPVVSDALK